MKVETKQPFVVGTYRLYNNIFKDIRGAHNIETLIRENWCFMLQ